MMVQQRAGRSRPLVFKSNQYVSKQGPKFNSSQISDFLKLIASDKSGRTSGAMPA